VSNLINLKGFGPKYPLVDATRESIWWEMERIFIDEVYILTGKGFLPLLLC
jgi:hypothetical protein